MTRFAIRTVAVGYVALVLVAPLLVVFVHAFGSGVGQFLAAITQPNALHALRLTLEATLVAVVANTVFGVGCALLLTRRRSWASPVLGAIVDLPFAVSPIIAGLALMLCYGQDGWLGRWLTHHGLQVIFTPTGIFLATIFVTLPFVAREVAPVLVEVGDEQEQAAATLGANARQAFRTITIPSIRWGICYGVVLTAARALGEYGAVAVVSGKVAGRTETMTTYIESRYDSFDTVAAYAASVVLATIAVLVLTAMTALANRTGASDGH